MCLNFTRVRETTPARQQGFGLLDGRDQSVVVLCCCSEIREKLEKRRTSCRGRSYYEVCDFNPIQTRGADYAPHTPACPPPPL